MEVKLVSFESLGVRSMCTFVTTPDLAILIDPSAACHNRSDSKPHPLEYEALVRKRREILDLSKEADVVVTSHYHTDHLTRAETDLVATFSTPDLAELTYSNKILLCKDPDRNVQPRQGERGAEFRTRFLRRASRWEVADGRTFTFGRTRISFSPPLWHGKEGTVQGYVVGTLVDDGDGKVAHASDVQLLNAGAVEWMLSQEPDLAIVAGPPIFDHERVSSEDEKYSLRLLGRLSQGVPEVVVDHHLLRSDRWRSFLEGLGDLRKKVYCAAEREGAPVRTYESQRRKLYEEEEVEGTFHDELASGHIPERLREVVMETGMERFYLTG